MTINGRTDKELDFRKMVEYSGHIVALCSTDGTLLYANPAFERAYGYPLREVVGKMNVNDYVHPEDVEGVANETLRAIAETGPNETVRSWAVFRFRCADGEYKKVWVVGTYLLEEPGIEGVIINATEFVE
ncbi:PAS domain S-box protein [Rubrobacter indicoceani]|uniref:PAS domain S-box protein n=1 Tax=Rubrobacter indicoceani TaxID=2051957 RepID=UPI000E5B6CD1|nr:PAS domain S-box protein [Rubrobacter indicoceani]